MSTAPSKSHSKTLIPSNLHWHAFPSFGETWMPGFGWACNYHLCHMKSSLGLKKPRGLRRKYNTKWYIYKSKLELKKICSFCTHLVIFNTPLVLLSPSGIMPRFLTRSLFLLLILELLLPSKHCLFSHKLSSYALPQNPILLITTRISNTSSAGNLVLALLLSACCDCRQLRKVTALKGFQNFCLPWARRDSLS